MYMKMNGQQAMRVRRGRTIVGSAAVADNSSSGVGCSADDGVRPCKGAVAVGASTAMKECPVCKARCFADMSVCYNCLHSFGSLEQKSAPQGTEPTVGNPAGGQPDDDGFAVDWQEAGGAEADGCNRAFGQEAYSVSLAEENGGDVSIAETAGIPAGEPFGITVSIPEGLSAACECGAPQLVHAGQLMEVVISIKVAQDARAGREALPAR